jgi:hypothetical protein
MKEKAAKTESKAKKFVADPAFLTTMSEYLTSLAHPDRFRILKYIEHEPKEIPDIAGHLGLSEYDLKKHLDSLVAAGLVIREAGLGPESAHGIYLVWKYSVTAGGLESLIRNIGLFSSITGLSQQPEIAARLNAARSAFLGTSDVTGPVLYHIEGIGKCHAYTLKKDRILMGRCDPDQPSRNPEGDIELDGDYRAVTRITRPHAIIIKSGVGWKIEDVDSTGGTYINSVRIPSHQPSVLSNGDILDLATGNYSARFLVLVNS